MEIAASAPAPLQACSLLAVAEDEFPICDMVLSRRRRSS